MALTTTPGDAAANSYASLVTAAAYHTARGNTAWTGTDAAKEAALIRATQWLDGRYGDRWPGVRWKLRLQALDWPRVDAFDRDGTDIDFDEVPVEVVNATCEAALRELTTPGILSPDITPGTAKVLTEVKGIKWTPLRSAAGVQDMTLSITAVDRALAPIIGGGSGQVQVLRA
jgi:hypothetical protein